MAGLSTHVLDTRIGRPGAGIRLTLHYLGAEHRQELGEFTTDEDGRVDGALLSAAQLRAGRYELCFYVGDYFRAQGAPLAEPPFLDDVVLRFAIADTDAHYHVPLLVSPWAYSTYRGS